MCVKLLTIKRCVGQDIVHRAYRPGRKVPYDNLRPGFLCILVLHLIDVMIPTMMSLVLYNAYSLYSTVCYLIYAEHQII